MYIELFSMTNIWKDNICHDKYSEYHNPFIADHSEASVDDYGFKGLLAQDNGQNKFLKEKSQLCLQIWPPEAANFLALEVWEEVYQEFLRMTNTMNVTNFS